MEFREPLQFERHGAQRFRGVMSDSEFALIEAELAQMPVGKPGLRLSGGGFTQIASVDAIARDAIGPAARPVRAVLFDKTASANWNLGWHQDRTIVVRKRMDTPGFGPWSVKGGLQHVEPPFALLAGMVTLRIHFDAVDCDNAPLMIAPGSHRLGKTRQDMVDARVASLGVAQCLADAGDVWLYATPILHASAPATSPRRRRVLQIDYAAAELPRGLGWLGV